MTFLNMIIYFEDIECQKNNFVTNVTPQHDYGKHVLNRKIWLNPNMN